MRPGRLVNLDFPLLFCTLGATIVGVLMVFSATNSTRTGAIALDDNAVKQAMFGGIGLLLMFALARVDFRFLESFTLPFYLVTVILLTLVTVLGVISYGAQRWLIWE